jgi:bla regulator protein blaR1
MPYHVRKITPSILLATPIILATLVAAPVFAQSKDTTTIARKFEVASIKPSDPSAGHNVQVQMAPGGRFVAKNLSIKMLIQQAYDVRDFQITGGPGWIGSERYDIVAKAEGDEEVRREQIKLMLQALLADRFKMTLHRDTKELPVYALVVGKSGSKLKAAEPLAEGERTGPGPGKGSMMRMGRGELTAQRAPMTILANMLAQQLGRPVLDRTGLKGEYDLNLQWTPDQGQGPGGPADTGGDHQTTATDSSGPSLFTAVQEQLGLKLESQKGPVEILIIDHIEKATEN